MVLPNFIDDAQGAFMKGKNAATTALASLEIIHHILNSPKTTNNTLNLAIKLDLSKAFDRVEWDFLLLTLHKFHFPPHIIGLIHKCLATNKIAIRYNKTKVPHFHPTRGLRQGDPLSPLLFLISVQVLIAMLHDSLHNHRWAPIIFKDNILNITDLAFADDIVLFCQ